MRKGDALVEKCCHFWDLMRLTLGGNPVRVDASTAANVNHQDESNNGQVPDIIDNGFVTVDFFNGARAMLDLCMFGEGSSWQEEISVAGAKARVEANVPVSARFSHGGRKRALEIVISHRDSKQVIRKVVEGDEIVLAAGDQQGSTYFQHVRYCDLVRSGQGMPVASLDDGLWSVLVGEAAGGRAHSGAQVSL